jgi:hypothetical protein
MQSLAVADTRVILLAALSSVAWYASAILVAECATTWFVTKSANNGQ